MVEYGFLIFDVSFVFKKAVSFVFKKALDRRSFLTYTKATETFK